MEKHISYKGGKIYFTDSGKGRCLVFLHGFLGAKEIWDGVKIELEKKFRVICIDLPGHGKSGNFGYFHSMELMADCVQGVLSSLRLRKAILLGHSMGGYVALAFAERFPDSLKGLGLINSTSYSDSPEKKRDRTRAIELVKNTQRVYTRNTIKNLFSDLNVDSKKKEIEFALQIALHTPQRGIVSALEGMKERKDRSILLRHSSYPVWFVLGKKDNVLKQKDIEEQIGLTKTQNVLLLEKDGHMSFLENEKEFLSSLYSFIRSCYKRPL